MRAYNENLLNKIFKNLHFASLAVKCAFKKSENLATLLLPKMRILQVSLNPITFFGNSAFTTSDWWSDTTIRQQQQQLQSEPHMGRATFRALITLSTFLQSAQVLELIREKAFRAVGVVAPVPLTLYGLMVWLAAETVWFFVQWKSCSFCSCALHLPPRASLIGEGRITRGRDTSVQIYHFMGADFEMSISRD